jgi:tetratricopeptide (TPR) repeat protein
MVERLAGNAALLSPDVVAEIVDRTDGVPLFVEEMTRAVLEVGDERGREIAASVPSVGLGVPATLQASLMARLDRLGPAPKAVAQIGAAIGREFSYELAASVGELDEERLHDALQRLVDAGLVFQRGTPPEAAYLFKHALVQDTAYNTFLRGPRRELHARIAQALETHFPEIVGGQPELLARHYSEAGLIEKSVEYWGRAGRRSAARSAMAEAAAQLQKGLDQLKLLPETRDRERHELELHSALGAVFVAVKGFAAPETGHVYVRAQELWERLGSPTEFLHLPFGQSFHHVIRGEFDLAERFDEKLLHLSHQRNDTAGLVLGHHSSGRTLFYRGRFVSSRWHQEAALRLYDPLSERLLVGQAGFSPCVGLLGFLGLALFCLGFPDQALTRSDEAIAEAQRLGHPPSLAVSFTLGARLLSLVGDNAVLGEQVDQLVAVANEQGFAQWGSVGTMFRGWVKITNGDVAEGLSFMRSGSAAFRAIGGGVDAQYNAIMASARVIAGQVEEGLALLDEALQRIGECWFAAELNRRKGQLLLRQGHTEDVEGLYCTALRIAREQEAKLWELRATVSLAQLRRDQGRRAEAHDLLAPVYSWFTEGFDTPDLKQARALLDELG